MRLGPNLSPGLERGVEDSQPGDTSYTFIHTHTFFILCIVHTYDISNAEIPQFLACVRHYVNCWD